MTNLAKNTASTAIRPEQRQILLVDDDVASLYAAQQTLAKNGFNVLTAENGLEALKTLERYSVDLVILDANMPIMNGFETCRQIRTSYRNRIPIIVATGLNDAESIDQAFNSGADDFIHKPVNYNILSRRLHTQFNNDQNTSLEEETAAKMEEMLTSISDYTFRLDAQGNFCQSVTSEISASLSLLTKKHCSIQCLIAQQSELPSHYFEDMKELPNYSKSPGFIISHDTEFSGYRFKMMLYKFNATTYYLTVNDLTEQLRSEQYIFKKANFDSESGLPNDACLTKSLAAFDINSQCKVKSLGLLKIVFTPTKKSMPDGDVNCYLNKISQITQAIGRIFSDVIDYTAIYRTELNELTVSLSQVEEKRFQVLVEQLHQSIIEKNKRENNNIEFSIQTFACIGKHPQCQASELPDILEFMRQNQSEANNLIQFFEPTLREQFIKRSTLEKMLADDIKNYRLNVHFQPKFLTKTLTLCGMEALLRWTTEAFGPVSPGEFIPLAESLGLMDELSRMVIDKSLDQLELWRKKGHRLVPISINLDASNLNNSQLINDLLVQIKQRDISPGLIEVEVTESVMIDAQSEALLNLRRLKKQGIKIAMDDFGTGYSSFSYLRELPLDTLKIDISFVRGIDTDLTSEAIAKTIVKLGHEVGLHVIAEGVENHVQLKKLNELNCDSVQGYLTGKPVDAETFAKLLEKSSEVA